MSIYKRCVLCTYTHYTLWHVFNILPSFSLLHPPPTLYHLNCVPSQPPNSDQNVWSTPNHQKRSPLQSQIRSWLKQSLGYGQRPQRLDTQFRCPPHRRKTTPVTAQSKPKIYFFFRSRSPRPKNFETQKFLLRISSQISSIHLYIVSSSWISPSANKLSTSILRVMTFVGLILVFVLLFWMIFYVKCLWLCLCCFEW